MTRHLLLVIASLYHTSVNGSITNNEYGSNHDKTLFGIIQNNDKCHNKKTFIPKKIDNERCSNNGNNILNIRGGGEGNGSISMNNNILPPAIASVIAGSIAGAVGVGVAFPLDKLKTKSQVLSSSSTSMKQKKKSYYSAVDIKNGGAVSSVAKMSNLQLVKCIWNTEGLKGFFGGVRAAMIGQAMIKAIAFTCNTNILKYLRKKRSVENISQSDEFSSLLLAACISGIITSFVVVPVERIKIIMQAQESSDDDHDSKKDYYKNELDCLRMVLYNEGWSGLCTRGLGTTICKFLHVIYKLYTNISNFISVREIPSYAIYFTLYGYAKNTKVAKTLGPLAPIVLGALSGCASWIPIYPIDVVKTLLQNTNNSQNDMSVGQMIQQLYDNGGISVFFDGLQPKLLESAVKHAIVFWLYNLVMSFLVVSDSK